MEIDHKDLLKLLTACQKEHKLHLDLAQGLEERLAEAKDRELLSRRTLATLCDLWHLTQGRLSPSEVEALSAGEYYAPIPGLEE